MLTEKDKKSYEKYSGNGAINALVYGFLKWFAEKPLVHGFINPDIRNAEYLKKFDAPTVFVPYHCLSVEDPLIGEILDDLGRKPHALITAKIFSKHRITYSLLEEVPFNTEATSFREDYKWSMEKLEEWLRKGESAIVFNDGETEQHERSMKESGREGIMPLNERPNSAIPANVAFSTNSQVIPIATYAPEKYENLFYGWGDCEKSLPNLFKNTWFSSDRNFRIPYTLEFLEPLKPEDFANPNELRREIRKRQLEAYTRLRKE